MFFTMLHLFGTSKIWYTSNKHHVHHTTGSTKPPTCTLQKKLHKEKSKSPDSFGKGRKNPCFLTQTL